MFVSEPPAAPRDQLADVPLDTLEERIAELAGRMAAGMARWLALVAEFDRREGWGGTGCGSTAEWVAWRCAVSPRAAREHVRVARALTALPLTRRRFERGELSYAKVRVLTRVADAGSEAKLLELARYATASQLERMLRAYLRVTSEEAMEAHEARGFDWAWDENGCLCFSGRLPAEEGAVLLAALDAARAALSAEQERDPEREQACEVTQRGPAGPRRPGNADALVAVAEAALARGPADPPGGERNLLCVHVDVDALAHDSRGRVQLRDGPALAPETARRLGCDAAVVTSPERDGRPLSVGRKTRTVPAAIRRAVEARDGGCRFPGCESRRWVDAHHIHHWARGGETSVENLVLLCRHHHRLVHEGGYSAKRLADGRVEFRHPGGWVVHPAPSPPPARRPLPAASGALLAGTGERMDLAACVDAVFATCSRP